MSTSLGDTDAELQSALGAFERAFSEGHLSDFARFFANDAQLFIHNQPTMSGKDAVTASFAQVFELFDTSAYEPTYEIIDVHDDSAYVLVSFEEVLRPHEGGPGVKVRGRNIQFWHRQDGAWRVVMLLTARSAPEESAQ